MGIDKSEIADKLPRHKEKRSRIMKTSGGMSFKSTFSDRFKNP